MIGFVVCLATFVTVSAQSYLYLGLNEKCRDGPKVWRCKILSECDILKEAIKNGQRPDVCSFQVREPIVCCPPSTQALLNSTSTQTRPVTQTRPPTRPWTSQTRPTTRTTTTKKYWWTEKFTQEQTTDKGHVWGSSWTTNSNKDRPKTTTTKKPSQKSKAEEMCEVYSKYVYRVEKPPVLIANQESEEILINECVIETLIVGGIDAKPKEFPHMALIGYGEKTKIEWLCGGSLISDKFVLSAAHCTKPNSRIARWVRLGDLDTSTDSDDARPVELGIKRRINHPKYNSHNLYHDIALYELESEVKLGPYIRPICLHTNKEVGRETALASGWGHTSWGGRGSPMLQKVNLTLINNQKCNREYGRGEYKQQLPNGVVEDNMICAGGELGKDTCQGDSGGPLQIGHRSIYCVYSQIGVVSFGKGCALTYPGVYTRVSSYVPWIESIVWP